MLSEQERRRNRRALEHALAQQNLEGLSVPQATIEDLERVARGEITTLDALQNAYGRFSNAQVFQ